MSAAPGRVIGAYRLIERIGRGGMGEVYRAQHLRLGRDAAIKLLPTTMADEAAFLRRFDREAASAAALERPSILPVWDYGDQDGIPYLVMPLMRGGTLDDRLRRGALTPDEILRYLQTMASALDHAHRHGIVHRDVKPANMLLDREGRLYLADFGIAKALASDENLTSTGMGVGTPEYMAPEHLQGRAEYRSDLYALAIVLYQMVTGQVPFHGGTPYEVIYKQLQSPPPPVRQRNPTVPAAVERVLEQALAKNPADRFQSGQALVDAFAAAAGLASSPPAHSQVPQRPISLAPPAQIPTAPGPIPTRPAPPAPTARPAASRLPFVLGIGGAVGVAAVLLVSCLVIVAVWPRATPTPTPTLRAAALLTPVPSPSATPPVTPAPPTPDPNQIAAATAQANATAQVQLTASAQSAATASAQSTAVAASSATATAQVRSQVSGTATAQATAAARARAQATATAQQDQAQATVNAWAANAQVIYGPENGRLDHNVDDDLIATKSTQISEGDIIIEATFLNPYQPSQGSWDYGFIFRDTSSSVSPNQGYRLFVRSDLTWELILTVGNPDASPLVTGNVPNLNTAAGGANTLTVYIKGGTALFFVNGTFVATLDVSAKVEVGNVKIGTGFYNGAEINGRWTEYQNFTIQRLR